MKNKFLKFYVHPDKGLQVDIIHSHEIIIPYQKLRDAVGGAMDIVSYVDFGEDNIMCYVDDEGLLKKLEPTFWLINKEQIHPYPLVGNVVVVDNENIIGDGLDTICLSDEQIEKVFNHIFTDGQHYFLYIDQEEIKAREEFRELLKNVGLNIHEISLEDFILSK